MAHPRLILNAAIHWERYADPKLPMDTLFILVQVEDHEGNPVTKLEKKNFQVFEMKGKDDVSISVAQDFEPPEYIKEPHFLPGMYRLALDYSTTRTGQLAFTVIARKNKVAKIGAGPPLVGQTLVSVVKLK